MFLMIKFAVFTHVTGLGRIQCLSQPFEICVCVLENFCKKKNLLTFHVYYASLSMKALRPHARWIIVVPFVASWLEDVLCRDHHSLWGTPQGFQFSSGFLCRFIGSSRRSSRWVKLGFAPNNNTKEKKQVFIFVAEQHLYQERRGIICTKMNSTCFFS